MSGIRLVQERLAKANVPIRQMENKITRRVDLPLRRAVDAQCNRPRVGSRGNGKVKLKLMLVPLEHEGDAGKDIFVTHFGVGGDVGVPTIWVVADIVVRFPRELIQSDDAGPGIGAY